MQHLRNAPCILTYGTYPEQSELECCFYSHEQNNIRECGVDIAIRPSLAIALSSDIVTPNALSRQIIAPFSEKKPLHAVVIEAICKALTKSGWQITTQQVAAEIANSLQRKPEYLEDAARLTDELHKRFSHYAQFETDASLAEPRTLSKIVEECGRNISEVVRTHKAKEKKAYRRPEFSLFSAQATPGRMLLEITRLVPLEQAKQLIAKEGFENTSFGEWLHDVVHDKASVQNSPFVDLLIKQEFAQVAALCRNHILTKSPCGKFTRLDELEHACQFLTKYKDRIDSIEKMCYRDDDEFGEGSIATQFHYIGIRTLNSSQSNVSETVENHHFSWGFNLDAEYHAIANEAINLSMKEGNKLPSSEVSEHSKAHFVATQKNYNRELVLWNAVCLVLAELIIKHYHQELERCLCAKKHTHLSLNQWGPRQREFRELWLERFPCPASFDQILSVIEHKSYKFKNDGEGRARETNAFLKIFGMDWIPRN